MSISVNLWIQAKSPLEENFISQNGVKIHNEENSYEDVFSKINEWRSFNKVYSEGNFSIFHSPVENGTYLIYSTFEELDKDGRHIPFMARISSVASYSDALKAVCRESSLYQLNPRKRIFIEEEKVEKRGMFVKVFSCVVVTLILIIILYFLCKNY